MAEAVIAGETTAPVLSLEFLTSEPHIWACPETTGVRTERRGFAQIPAFGFPCGRDWLSGPPW